MQFLRCVTKALIFGISCCQEAPKVDPSGNGSDDSKTDKTINPEDVMCTRLVAVADLHGDWDHAMRVLQATGLVELIPKNDDDRRPENYKWVAKPHECMVHTGDIVDRGEYSMQLYDLFYLLRSQATKGKLINIYGNHETLNLVGQFQYVAPLEIKHWHPDPKLRLEQKGTKQTREKMWMGEWGDKLIDEYQTIHQFNQTLFVHGGLEKQYAFGGSVAKLNAETRSKLKALRARKIGFEEGHIIFDNGPQWTRIVSEGAESGPKNICETELEPVLKLFGANRMIVGHTPVPYGKIMEKCGGRYFRIDTFISKNGYGDCWRTPVTYCKGGLNFLTIEDNKAFAHEVSETGPIKITKTKAKNNWVPKEADDSKVKEEL